MTFEEFAQSRLQALLAFATVLTGQRATAEDVTQEVLIRAHDRWDQIARLDRPELYVRKIASGRPVPACHSVPGRVRPWSPHDRADGTAHPLDFAQRTA